MNIPVWLITAAHVLFGTALAALVVFIVLSYEARKR